jgi:enolase-phosphatase E1
MTHPPLRPPRVILTDIEGTTGSIAFVREVLFPYADLRMVDFVTAHRDDPVVLQLLNDAAELNGTPDFDEGQTVALLRRWIGEDRKATPLKTLQGLIWADGYSSAALQGHVYEDAAAALRDWHAQGIALYVYSSGSIAAQRLLFGFSSAGDLTPILSGYFDTTVGAKSEPASYRRIAAEIGARPSEILFLSDSVPELDAAGVVGMQTVCVQRDDRPPGTTQHTVVRTLAGLFPTVAESR